MIVTKLIFLSALGPLFMTSCLDREERFKQKVVEAMHENPEILAHYMKQNSLDFARAFHHAMESTKQESIEKREREHRLKKEEALSLQFSPQVRDDELIQGKDNAPLILVMYSDFESHQSAEAFKTVKKLLSSYEGKIKFIQKHLPMEMHANAMISAQYYEALRLQNKELAIKFQNQLFNNQNKLRRGESYLKKLAHELGANQEQLVHDLKSSSVEKRIEQDMNEAKEFGLRSSPSFLLNGVPITGAYPADRFEQLISELYGRQYVSQ